MPTGFQPWFEFESQAAKLIKLFLGIGRLYRVKPLAPNSKCRWWLCLGAAVDGLSFRRSTTFAVDNPF
jgi:hypothetical protein